MAEAGANDPWDNPFKSPGRTRVTNGSAIFPDLDGSELGYVLMEAMRVRRQRRRHPPDARGGHLGSAATSSGFTLSLWEEGRAHPTCDHHGGVSPRGAARARRRIPGGLREGRFCHVEFCGRVFTQPGFPAPGPGPIPHCVTRSLLLASAVTTGCLCPLNSSTRSGAPPRPHHRPAPGASRGARRRRWPRRRLSPRALEIVLTEIGGAGGRCCGGATGRLHSRQ